MDDETQPRKGAVPSEDSTQQSDPLLTLGFNTDEIQYKKQQWTRRVEACEESLCWCSKEPIVGLEYGANDHIVYILHGTDRIRRAYCSFRGEITEEMRAFYGDSQANR